MNINILYSTHPQDAKKLDTQQLRDRFLVNNLMQKNELNITYTTYDRFILGSAVPGSDDIYLEAFDELKAPYFLYNRELGIVNIGSKGMVSIDGEIIELDYKEALYVGRGIREVIFLKSEGAAYYFNSTIAHKEYPVKKIGKEDAIVINLGEDKYANKRVLNKLIVNDILDTCQLQMGMTEITESNVWNTMPAHTHLRRMEAYFYFDLNEGQTISHFMGEPSQTRHLFLENHHAVISPPWSIHSGSGTSNYAFIWGMAGENQDYSDMDILNFNGLR